MKNEHVNDPVEMPGQIEAMPGQTEAQKLADAPGRTPEPTDRYDLRARVSAGLTEFVDRQAAVLGEIGADFEPVVGALRTFLDGGKRIRAAFCYWG